LEGTYIPHDLRVDGRIVRFLPYFICQASRLHGELGLELLEGIGQDFEPTGHNKVDDFVSKRAPFYSSYALLDIVKVP
jgi:hypothetical protein